jgi:hypothetical protein
MPKLNFKKFKIFISAFLTSLVFMNYLVYVASPKLFLYEFEDLLPVISLIGLIFLCTEVKNRKPAIPFAIFLLACIFLPPTYRLFPNIFPTHDSFAVVEYTLFSALIISASIFLYSDTEVGKQAVVGFSVFVLLYSALTLVPSAYDVLFTEHHLIRESLLLFYGLFQLIATIFGLFYVGVWVVNLSRLAAE